MRYSYALAMISAQRSDYKTVMRFVRLLAAGEAASRPLILVSEQPADRLGVAWKGFSPSRRRFTSWIWGLGPRRFHYRIARTFNEKAVAENAARPPPPSQATGTLAAFMADCEARAAASRVRVG
jgi:hypothetical protein